jgi:hypothetical protein
MEIEKDIEYYVEILRKANVMESTDVILCKSILVKCVQIIQNNPEMFVNRYPKRKKDESNLLKRITRLNKKYGAALDEAEEDFIAGSSFSSFVSEASERSKILASRNQYKEALTVLREAKKMAKDYGLTEQIKILNQQSKLYAGEKKAYDKKVKNLDALVKQTKKDIEAGILPVIVDDCNKVIPLASQLKKAKITDTHQDILDNTQDEISDLSKLLPELIDKAKREELAGDVEGAIEACKKIVECAHALGNDEIEKQFTEKQEDLRKQDDVQKEDLETKLKYYMDKLEKDQESARYNDAIEDCTHIIDLAPALKQPELIEEYTKKIEDLKEKYKEEQLRIKDELTKLSKEINRHEKDKNLKEAINSTKKVLDIVAKLQNQPLFEKYNSHLIKLQDKLELEQKQIKLKVKEIEQEIDANLEKHDLPNAIEQCEALIEFAEKNNQPDLLEQFQQRLKELQNLYKKEQKIVDDQLAQLIINIDDNLDDDNMELGLENLDKILALAKRNNRPEIVAKYTKLKDQHTDEKQKAEEKERQRIKDEKRAAREEAERKAREEELEKAKEEQERSRKDKEERDRLAAEKLAAEELDRKAQDQLESQASETKKSKDDCEEKLRLLIEELKKERAKNKAAEESARKAIAEANRAKEEARKMKEEARLQATKLMLESQQTTVAPDEITKLVEQAQNYYDTSLNLYELIKKLFTDLKDVLKELRNTAPGKIEFTLKKSNKRGGDIADKLNSLLGTLNTLRSDFGTKISKEEDTLSDALKKLKNNDIDEAVEDLRTEAINVIKRYADSINENQLGRLELFDDNDSDSMQQLSSKIGKLSKTLDNVQDRLIENIEKLKLGMIQKSINNIIRAILKNDVETIKVALQQDFTTIFSDPLKMIVKTQKTEYKNNLEDPLEDLINYSMDQIKENAKDKTNIGDELYDLFGKISTDYNATFSSARKKVINVLDEVGESFKISDTNATLDINKEFNDLIDQIDEKVDVSIVELKVIWDNADMEPPETPKFETKTNMSLDIPKEEVIKKEKKKSTFSNKPKDPDSNKPKVSSLPKKQTE